MGPSFVLSPPDEARLQDLLARPRTTPRAPAGGLVSFAHAQRNFPLRRRSGDPQALFPEALASGAGAEAAHLSAGAGLLLPRGRWRPCAPMQLKGIRSGSHALAAHAQRRADRRPPAQTPLRRCATGRAPPPDVAEFPWPKPDPQPDLTPDRRPEPAPAPQAVRTSSASRSRNLSRPAVDAPAQIRVAKRPLLPPLALGIGGARVVLGAGARLSDAPGVAAQGLGPPASRAASRARPRRLRLGSIRSIATASCRSTGIATPRAAQHGRCAARRSPMADRCHRQIRSGSRRICETGVLHYARQSGRWT